MKRRITSSKSFFALSVLMAFMLWTTNLSAQSSAVSAPMTTDAYEHTATWKLPADYSAVVASERLNNLLLLGTPGLKATKNALYTSYDRLLGYMQVALIANDPIEAIAEKSFKKVSLESTSDPVIMDTPTDEFVILYDLLVLKLKDQ